MRNITIKLDDAVARWTRVEAARHDQSVSRLVGGLLAERMRHEKAYDLAMNRFLARPPRRMRAKAPRLPLRDTLYDRG